MQAAHPYTKGKVERLVRFVKGNFLAGRSFTDLDALNREAALWCAEQGGRWRRAAACVPMREHEAACSANTRPLEVTAEVERYLCPRRKISFDGFVSFEGHRYGVPYWYVRRECRVNREGRVVHVSVNLFFTSFAKQARRSRKGGFTGCANVFSPIPVTA